MLPRPKFAARCVAVLALTTFLPGAVWAQEPAPEAPQPQQHHLRDYSKAPGHFPNIIAPYTPQHVPKANVSNTTRIDDLLKDGKLYLSMNDAVALALENNLDIAIARYNLNIAETDILRAKAGASILGGNFGLVQGTPGGTQGGLSGVVGSGSGGTTAGLGGAATGAGGIVQSTEGLGPNITSFDPVVTGTLSLDHNHLLSASSFAVPVESTNTAQANFAYLQGFATGTNLSVGFNNSRVADTSSPYSSLSPFINTNFQARVTQHLLQGIGLAPNTRFIRIAKNNREISDVAFRLQVITTVNQIESIYWDLVYAYENVRVNKESLAFAQKTLSDTKKQVEIGTLAPIEVVRAQSTVSGDQRSLTIAQTNLQLQQLLMKNALSRTLVDPTLAGAEVIPTSTMTIPQSEQVVPTEDLINDALTHRADLAELRIDLTNRQISNRAIRNLLLPSVDLFAYYGGSGLAGSQNPTNLCNPSNPVFGCSPSPTAPVGYTTALNQLIDSTAADKGAGLTINIPIRNRANEAVQVRSALEYRQAQLRLLQLENQVRIEVRNAQFALQQNRAAVEAAQAAVDLARTSLDAEQKKYSLGASTITLVLQNQSAQATSESDLVSAMAAYAKSQVELDRATGLLLDHSGIVLGDAVHGAVTHMPSIPYVAPRQEPPATQPPAATQPQ